MINKSIRRPLHAIALATLATAILALLGSIALASSSSAEGAPRSQMPSKPGSLLAGDPTETDSRIPGRYIVVFKDSVSHPASLAQAQIEQRDGELGFVYRHALKGYSAELSKNDVEVLRRDPRVAYVTPDHKVETLAQETPTGIDRIFAPSNEALEINEQDDLRVDVDVAVIDTGIDYEHPDLNVVGRTNCQVSLDEKGVCLGGSGKDGNGHGTHVAGTVGAIDDGIGVVGVAPGARLWAVKVLNYLGFGGESEVIAGVDWVTATREDEDPSNDIEVANMSLGCLCLQPALDEAIDSSVQAGVVHVVAAGNNGMSASYVSPARNSNVITVSALADYDGAPGGEGVPLKHPACTEPDAKSTLGLDDALAKFSNHGEAIEIAAPGVCIRSTLPTGGSILGANYGVLSGTSMASPHVAGAAALLASIEKPTDQEDVEAIRDAIAAEGNFDWEDTSGDGEHEPLLDVHGEAAFDPADQVAITQEATILSASEAELHGEVNPSGLKTTYRFEYGPTESYGQSVPASPESAGSGSGYLKVSETLENLEGQTGYHYRLVASNAAGTFHGQDRILATTPASVTTEAASEVGGSSATLRGTVNPEGLSTSYYFEYGTSAAYGSIAPLPPKDLGSGTQDIKVDETVSSLFPATNYHFRLVAVSPAGTTFGEDETFETEGPPIVSPGWTSKVTHDEAELKASIDPQGKATTAYFEYGPTESYGTKVPVSPKSIGSGKGYVSFEETLGGLKKHTTYHFRAVATNADGTTYGKDSTFSTIGQWSLQSTPNPKAKDDSRLSDVSCASSSACLAVGYDDYEDRGFTEFWDGKAWTLHKGSLDRRPTAVSCGSASACLAVGLKNGTQVLAELWAGEEGPWWEGSELAPKTPEGGSGLALEGVSCTAATTCTAVGSYLKGGKSLPLVERLSGTFTPSWSIQSAATANEAFLNDVSCASATSCVSVGSMLHNGKWVAHAESWNGEKWTSLGVPFIGTTANLSEVSCSSTTACLAIGTYTGEAGEKLFAATWNGAKWTLASGGLKGALPLQDVSCKSASLCIAVGSEASKTLAQAWNGEEWSTQTSPNPEGKTSASLSGISCSSTTTCRAVGSSGAGGEYVTLGESYE